jgi:hypothetical protein
MRPVGAKLLRRTDGQTDVKLMVTFCSFADAPKNRCNYSQRYNPHSYIFTSTFFFKVFLLYNLLVGRRKIGTEFAN